MMKYQELSKIGIVGFGTYIPHLRLRISEVAEAYGAQGKQVENNLEVEEKAVSNWDEDTATMAYMACRRALDMAGVDSKKIGALYIGSESHPYSVKPTSTIVGEALDVGNSYMAADLEFACKAGTAAVQMIASHLESDVIAYGLAVGADRAQAMPGDVLEYTASSGAGALLLGKRRILAKLEGFMSFTSDTTDFWRRSGQKYPSHAGRFTGEPAYFRHVVEGTKQFFKVTSTGYEDYDQVVFHMPNGKFPRRAAKRLGFSEKQLEHGFIVSKIGNPYNASSLIGLCRVLEKTKAGQRILVTSYGSGSGSDTLSFLTTPLLIKARRKSGEYSGMKIRYLTYGKYRAMGS